MQLTNEQVKLIREALKEAAISFRPEKALKCRELCELLDVGATAVTV